MSIHSSCKKSRERCRKKKDKSPDSSLLTSKQQIINKPSKQKECISHSVISDCESYTSSLEDLNLESDSDYQECSKENIGSKQNNLSARKKLQFESCSEIQENNNSTNKNFQSPNSKPQKMTSPSTLRTPLENILTAKGTPPRRTSHNRRSLILSNLSNVSPDGTVLLSESVKRRYQYDGEAEFEPHLKYPRSDPPKARLSLFNNTCSTEVIPAKSFYSKSNKSGIENILPNKVKTVDKLESSKKIRNVEHQSYISRSHRRYKKKGEINRGVRHGIRKPKLNKKKYISKERALQLSLELIENSPLNNYIEKFMKDTSNDIKIDNAINSITPSHVHRFNSILEQYKCDTFKTNDLENINDDDSEGFSESTLKNKKFFKSRDYAMKRALIKLPHMRLRMKNGKLYLPEHRNKITNFSKSQRSVSELYSSMQNDISELLNDQIDDIQEKSTVESLLNQWCEEDVPISEPLIIRQTEEIHKNIENAEMLLQSRSYNINSVDNNSNVASHDKENNTAFSAIDLNENESNSTNDTAYVSDSSSGQTFELLPVNGGYIFVGDTEMIDTSMSSDRIDFELDQIDKNITDIAKANNINPQVLLSPTTQMCSMTSDLVLTSPKLASLNINPLLENIDVSKYDETKKLYPLFKKSDKTNKILSTSQEKNDINTVIPSVLNKKVKNFLKDQYVIDAGQKKFGITECFECGIVYQIGDPIDENDHLTHHMAVDILKFQGWKSERFCGRWGEGRVIVVVPGDPASHWQRVYNLLERIVNPQLGYSAPLSREKSYKVYLYIEKKIIVGCLVAEVIKEASKFVNDNNVECCSTEKYSVKCGVSRIWTHKAYRRRRIATNLINSMRVNFMFGHVLLCEEIAFSSPTPMGRKLAEKYFNTPNFYIYVH